MESHESCAEISGISEDEDASFTESKHILPVPFDYTRLCMFCERECSRKKENKKKKNKRVIFDLTENAAKNMLAMFEGFKDPEAELLRERIRHAPKRDIEAGAEYHIICKSDYQKRFSYQRAIRRPNEVKEKLRELFNFMRKSGREQFTLRSLIGKFGGDSQDRDHIKMLEEALLDEFGENIIITQSHPDARKLVTFSSAQAKIYHKYYEINHPKTPNQNDIAPECNIVINTGSSIIIKTEIDVDDFDMNETDPLA